MKNGLKVLAGVIVLCVALGGFSYADAEKGSGTIVNGIGNVVKLPLKVLDKWSNSLDNASMGPSASEDVAVSDVYDLDAETTG